MRLNQAVMNVQTDQSLCSGGVATLRARRFSHWGELGYFTSIFLTLARFNRRPFPVRVEGQEAFDDRRCLFVTFNNSKFTGGTMMIAPDARARRMSPSLIAPTPRSMTRR